MVLLAACGQNAIPEESLGAEGDPVVAIRIERSVVLGARLFENICRNHPLLCGDESVFFPVKVDPICTRAICNNPTDVLLEGSYRVNLVMPELAQTPSQFARAFKLELVDVSGKVLAQAVADTETARLELAAKLPKGKYNLRVQILNVDVAKLVQSSPSKYPFNFIISAAK